MSTALTTARKSASKKKPTLVQVGRQPFPLLMQSTQKYAELVTLTLDSGGAFYYTFSCNGMYDPNVSSTGHQPLYFDSMTEIYNHFTVLTSKIKITPFYTSAGYPALYTLFKDDDSNPSLTAYSTAIERPGSMTVVADLARNVATPLWSSWDAKKTFGGDPLSNDNLQGSSASNPSEVTNYMVNIYGGANLAGATVQFLAEIWYDAVWDELKSIGGS